MALRNPQAAAALLLQLDTYARPSEIVNLQRSDIIRPVSKHYAPRLLRTICLSRHTTPGPLFPDLTLATYEAEFRISKKQIGLNAFQLEPHTVRHSGPSVDSLNRSRTSLEIQARGRWKCQKSILRYQKPGQMLSKMSRIPDEVWQRSKIALPQAMQLISQFYGKR